MNILVTGGAGFIGSHIVEEFQNIADKIIVFDDFSTGKIENLKGFKYELIEGSITNRDNIRKAVKNVDFIFHMAAKISVVESIEKPIEYTEVNTIGTLILLEEASAARVRKLCFCSSAAVYGDNPQSPKTEDMKPQPLSPYAVTKLDGEYYCEIFTREKKLQTACLRYFNVFGPRQDPKSQYAAAIPIFISRAIQNQDLVIFGDGEQTRDFVYVKDIVSANKFMIENPDITGIFNVAGGRSITINKLAEKIIRETGSKSKIIHHSERPGEIRHSLASINKLLSTGFNPSPISFDETLKTTINFFRENYP